MLRTCISCCCCSLGVCWDIFNCYSHLYLQVNSLFTCIFVIFEKWYLVDLFAEVCSTTIYISLFKLSSVCKVYLYFKTVSSKNKTNIHHFAKSVDFLCYMCAHSGSFQSGMKIWFQENFKNRAEEWKHGHVQNCELCKLLTIHFEATVKKVPSIAKL